MECHYYIGRVSVTRALLGRVLLTLLHSSRARWWMGKMKWDYLFRYCTMEHMQSVARYGDVEATTSRSKCERVGCHPFALHRKIENLIKQREPETHSFYTLLWYWYIITTTTTIIIFKPFSCLFIVQRFSVVSVEMRNVIKMRAFYLYFFSRFVSLDVNWKEKNTKYRFISERNDITNLRFSIKKKNIIRRKTYGGNDVYDVQSSLITLYSFQSQRSMFESTKTGRKFNTNIVIGFYFSHKSPRCQFFHYKNERLAFSISNK